MNLFPFSILSVELWGTDTLFNLFIFHVISPAVRSPIVGPDELNFAARLPFNRDNTLLYSGGCFRLLLKKGQTNSSVKSS